MFDDDDFNKAMKGIEKKAKAGFALASIGTVIVLVIYGSIAVAAIWALGHFIFRAW